MKGTYKFGFYTGGSEYMVRWDKEYDLYYLYRIEYEDEAILVHTSVSEKNMEAYLEDLRYANMDYDLNL